MNTVSVTIQPGGQVSHDQKSLVWGWQVDWLSSSEPITHTHCALYWCDVGCHPLGQPTLHDENVPEFATHALTLADGPPAQLASKAKLWTW